MTFGFRFDSYVFILCKVVLEEESLNDEIWCNSKVLCIITNVKKRSLY